jgi:hypothetical protein
MRLTGEVGRGGLVSRVGSTLDLGARSGRPARPAAVALGVALALAATLALAPAAWSQEPAVPGQPAGGVTNVEADPLRCWWQASAGAVRVGEPFTLTLTCAALETDSTQVVVDRSRLEPSVLALPPFDVTGGTTAADMTTAQRRFFQYTYQVRILSDLLFGQDAKIPPLTLNYKIENRSNETGVTQGRDQSYVLPPLSIRVHSLVAGDSTDIRDATTMSLADVESRRLRGRSLAMAGTVLYGLAALLLVLAVVRLLAGLRTRKGVAGNAVSDRAVLQGVARELAEVARQRQAEGWTEALAARAQAALRVVAGYALGRTVPQQVVGDTTAALDGQLAIARWFPRRRRVIVSAAMTPAEIEAAMDADPSGTARVAPVRDGLQALTAGRYGRRAMDESAVDLAVEQARALARSLAVEHSTPVRKLRQLARLGGATRTEGAAWAR